MRIIRLTDAEWDEFKHLFADGDKPRHVGRRVSVTIDPERIADTARLARAAGPFLANNDDVELGQTWRRLDGKVKAVVQGYSHPWVYLAPEEDDDVAVHISHLHKNFALVADGQA